jgi:non-ribosomal peptide synthetase component F
MLVAALQPQRSLQYAPLFQVKLVLQTPPMGRLEVSDLRLQILEVDRETAGFDVLLYLWDTSTGLQGWFEYSTDLFAASTMARLAEDFTMVLQYGVTQPDTRLDVLDAILSAADRQHRSRQHRERQALHLRALQNSKRQPVGVFPLQHEARP